jgi:pimeloyl-ACP methyl ester carboxylesterase
MNVPGAALYYEVRGSGRVLLMICGGPTDAGVYAGVADVLADRYRVVTYDPRGNSRSAVSGPAADQQLDVHGDDAAALLAEFGSAPAYVFGSSGGAQIGLNLAARYPARVRTLVAHEPPCMQLLPDAAEQKAGAAAVLETYRASGAQAAFAQFQTYAGMNNAADAPRPAPPSPELQQTIARTSRNMDFFFAHGMVPIAAYVPDVAALRAGTVRAIVGAGETTAGQSPHQAALALAAQLDLDVVPFPGDHVGYMRAPAAFAERLNDVLRGE